MYQVAAKRKSKKRRSSTLKTPILPSIGSISMFKTDKKFMSGVRDEMTKLPIKEKSSDNLSGAVKLEEEKVVRVNARQLQTLFGEMTPQREQATSWGSLRSRLTNASMRGALTTAKVNNNAGSKMFFLTITFSMINNLAKYGPQINLTYCTLEITSLPKILKYRVPESDICQT